MKKLLLVILLISWGITIKAQNSVENFNVGPYEVDYKGQGDINYRLKKGINLYDFYGLKRDTIIYITNERKPLKKGVQIDLSFSMLQYSKGLRNVFGMGAYWKQRIAKFTYFNIGGCIATSYGKYATYELKENMIEFSSPISIEFGNLSKNKATIYGSIGIVPTYYLTIKKEIINSANMELKEETPAFSIAPRLDFGGYIPTSTKLMKIGFYGLYNINCSNKNYILFNEHIGHFFIGINLGMIF